MFDKYERFNKCRFGGLIIIMSNKSKFLICNTTFRITIIYKILFLKQIMKACEDLDDGYDAPTLR